MFHLLSRTQRNDGLMGAGPVDRVCPLVCGKYFPLLDAHLGGLPAYIIIILLANLVGFGTIPWKILSFFGWQNFLFPFLDNNISKNRKFDGLYKHFWEARIQKFQFVDNKISKKGNFDGLYKHFLEAKIQKILFLDNRISKKETFDGLYKQIIWSTD